MAKTREGMFRSIGKWLGPGFDAEVTHETCSRSAAAHQTKDKNRFETFPHFNNSQPRSNATSVRKCSDTSFIDLRAKNIRVSVPAPTPTARMTAPSLESKMRKLPTFLRLSTSLYHWQSISESRRDFWIRQFGGATTQFKKSRRSDPTFADNLTILQNACTTILNHIVRSQIRTARISRNLSALLASQERHWYFRRLTK